MFGFYTAYRDLPFVAPVVRQIQTPHNEGNTIIAPLVPQLEGDFGLNALSDIRNTLLAQISWSHHLIILGRCKTPEEREFYLKLSIREYYSKRELDRQICSSAFERTIIGNAKLPESIKQLPQDMTNAFKDSYVFEFLSLPETYIENDLRKALLVELKRKPSVNPVLFLRSE